MRVLILTSQIHEGAAELLSTQLAVNLNRLGVHTIVTGMYSESNKEISLAKERLIEAGVPIVNFLKLPINPSPLHILLGIIRLRILLRKEKINIIETSSESLGILTVISTLGTKVFHVAGLHQTFYRKNNQDNKSPCKTRERFFTLFIRLRKKVAFYAASQCVKDSWLDFSSTNELRTKVIYNNIEIKKNVTNKNLLRERLYSELNIPRTSKVAISVGRLCSYRKQDLLLESLSPLLTSGELVLIFVGAIDFTVPETQKMINRMESITVNQSLKPFIRYLGHRSDIQKLMIASDVLVNSTAREAFGLVIIESLAMGLPVVATKIEAIPELLPEVDNIIVDHFDKIAFREAVSEVINRDDFLKDQISLRNEKYGQTFTPEKRVKEMLSYYLELLSLQ